VRADLAGTDPADVLNPPLSLHWPSAASPWPASTPNRDPTNLTSTDATERNAGMLRVPLVASLCRPGDCLELFVVLVVVAAVYGKLLGPDLD
jgi:hypothetical protein